MYYYYSTAATGISSSKLLSSDINDSGYIRCCVPHAPRSPDSFEHNCKHQWNNL